MSDYNVRAYSPVDIGNYFPDCFTGSAFYYFYSVLDVFIHSVVAGNSCFNPVAVSFKCQN